MKNQTITSVSRAVRQGDITLAEYAKKILTETKKINKTHNYFCTISEQEFLEASTNEQHQTPLSGIALAIKDSIVVQGIESRAGSRILEGYKPLFTATCVQRAMDKGGMVLGKTNQDEFGFGAFNVNVGLGFEIPKNPFDKERSCGGSSGGAAGIVQRASYPMISYGESTGGSIAFPASFCGVFGLCPTYGRVSRYGLIDYANSLDKIGPLAKNAEDIATSLSIISGYDPNDSTSLNAPTEDYNKYLTQSLKGMRIGIITEGFGEHVTEEVKNAVHKGIEKLQELGARTAEVSTPTAVEYGIPTYYFLSTSEASTNLAKLCGLRYGKSEKIEGNFNQYFTAVRSKHFGKEAKRRIMIGTFARMAGYRDAYYIRAAKVRTLIIQEYQKLFEKYDVLICPTAPYLPPKIAEIEQMPPLHHYMADILTVGPNLAGLPHMNVPVGTSKGLPVGMLAIGNHLSEGNLIALAKEFRAPTWE